MWKVSVQDCMDYLRSKHNGLKIRGQFPGSFGKRCCNWMYQISFAENVEVIEPSPPLSPPGEEPNSPGETPDSLDDTS